MIATWEKLDQEACQFADSRLSGGNKAQNKKKPGRTGLFLSSLWTVERFETGNLVPRRGLRSWAASSLIS